MTWIDILGGAAAAGVVASFAMRSVVKLRIASLIGSSLYVGYGVAIGSWPVAVTNAVVVLVNGVNLSRDVAERRTPPEPAQEGPGSE